MKTIAQWKAIISLYYRITNALKMCWFVFKKPELLNDNNYKVLSNLCDLIMKVATENRHMMAHVAYVYPKNSNDEQIVSIWAGAGMAASPTKRIAELLSENSMLKAELSKHVAAQNNV